MNMDFRSSNINWKSQLSDLKHILYHFNLLKRDALSGTITQNKTANKEH